MPVPVAATRPASLTVVTAGTWAIAWVATAALVGAWLLWPADGGGRGAPAVEEAPAAAPAAGPLKLKARVVAVHPHDPEAYTQGLAWADGRLYESTGLYRRSKVRRVELSSGRVEAEVALADDLFGEGLAVVGERLLQLTWRQGVALVYDRASFEPAGRFDYRGEGWGLCFDGRRLFMSDGGSRLTVRSPGDFSPIGSVEVRLAGRPVPYLNELECAEGWVYANLFQADSIVRIDPETGEVLATIDGSGLIPAAARTPEQVLNGIAWVPERGTFLLTGKLWPQLFEVVFVEK